MIDYDKLHLAPRKDVATATFALVDVNQQRSAEVQVAAASCLFLLICERFRVHPGNALTVAENIINSNEGGRPEFKGARAYLKEEIQ